MTLHVETRGHGPNLILLHGWGMNSGIWNVVADELSQHFTLHLVDLPGYGDSQSEQTLDFTQTAQLLAAELPAGYWLGWSLGGLLAIQVALENPKQVEALVTVASSAAFVEGSHWPGMKANVLALFAKGLAQDYRKTLERFLAIQTLGSPQAKEDIRVIRHELQQRPEPRLEQLELGLNWLRDIDLRERLGELTMPWLQIYGKLDSLVPKEAMAAHQHYHEASQTLIPKAAHAPFISHPQQFTETLIHFLCS